MSQAAAQLVEKAKAKMNEFYAPAMVQEDTDGAASFVQVRSHSKARLGSEDTAWASADQAQVQTHKNGNAVIGLMDGIIRDLQGDIKDAENEEKQAATDYSKLMENSQATRTQDGKSLTNKEADRAAAESSIVA